MGGIYQNTLGHKKNGIFHLQQLGWTLRAFANCKKGQTEKEILYDFTDLWNPRKQNKQANKSKQNRTEPST